MLNPAPVLILIFLGGIIPTSAHNLLLTVYKVQSSKGHMECWRWNQDQPHARQPLKFLSYLSYSYFIKLLSEIFYIFYCIQIRADLQLDVHWILLEQVYQKYFQIRDKHLYLPILITNCGLFYSSKSNLCDEAFIVNSYF